MKDYIEQALLTESNIGSTMLSESNTRLLHAGIGMATESGEFLDALKKHIFYGKPLDIVNLKEELGDLFWYMAIACDVIGTDFESEMRRNIAKLRLRYGHKFSQYDAENRSLDKEREVLENDE